MTEREAATKLDTVCFCYGQSNERKARLSKAIMDYIQAVQQNGLDNHLGYFSLSHIRDTFGIECTDQPQSGTIRLLHSEYNQEDLWGFQI